MIIMKEKPLNLQSIDELYQNEQNTTKELTRNSIVMMVIIAISIFVTSENGVGLFTIFPVFCSYPILSSYIRLKNIREEIRSRLINLKNR